MIARVLDHSHTLRRTFALTFLLRGGFRLGLLRLRRLRFETESRVDLGADGEKVRLVRLPDPLRQLVVEGTGGTFASSAGSGRERGLQERERVFDGDTLRLVATAIHEFERHGLAAELKNLRAVVRGDVVVKTVLDDMLRLDRRDVRLVVEGDEFPERDEDAGDDDRFTNETLVCLEGVIGRGVGAIAGTDGAGTQRLRDDDADEGLGLDGIGTDD